MEALFIYLLKANAALAVFYLLYVVLLRKDTFIRLKRHYFLAAIVFSLVYPLFAVPQLGGLFQFLQPERQTETMILVDDLSMAVVPGETEKIPAKPFPWETALLWTALAGTAAFSARLLLQLFSIFRLKKRSARQTVHGVSVRVLDDRTAPFSFFTWIFINASSLHEGDVDQILLHEQTHARQWHSADIMAAEILCVCFWWNPAVWLLKKEVAINLEYLADSGVLRSGANGKEYQYHLLRLTYPETAVQIVNNFNVSQLKQRIMMMNKSKSPTRKLAKYLAILPVALSLVAFNSCTNKKQQAENENADTVVETVAPSPENEKKDSVDEVFTVVEHQPEFPGGKEALMKYLADNLKYPVDAQQKGLDGRVICNFVVEKDGSISDVEVVRGAAPSLDKEAVRAIETMPKWNPGKQNGQVVRVRYTLPVIFKLNGTIRFVPPVIKKDEDKKKSEAVKEKGSEDVFTVVEHQPEFPGGQSAMMKYITDNLRYPDIPGDGIQGRVICTFIVEKDGSISDVKVVKGVDPSLDKEAVRMIESMPKWKPGMHSEQAVRTRFSLPVTFRLQQ